MCKLAIIPGIKPQHAKKALKLAIALTPIMTVHDHDGFGYMALGTSGMFGERWLNTKDAWKSRNSSSPKDSAVLNKYQGILSKDATYNSFGTFSDDITCLALHARMATCGGYIENTHPFVSLDGKTALIHNGVINNVRDYPRGISTCDSEVILTDYLEKDVTNKPDKISQVTKDLEGYFACAVLSQQISGRWILDIFRDDRANLEAVYVPQIDATVFCTKAEMVLDACKALKWRGASVFEVAEKMFVRHDAVTGEVLTALDIETREVRSWPTSISSTTLSSDDGELVKDYPIIAQELSDLEDQREAELQAELDAELADPFYNSDHYKRGRYGY